MADWNALRHYIKANYKVARDDLSTIQLVFDLGNGRSQAVLVSEISDSGWAEVSTAVCDGSQIDPRNALIRNARMRVGGLALVDGGPVIFRHSFPLATLDPSEFEEPLHIAAQFGDQLERELAGSDHF